MSNIICNNNKIKEKKSISEPLVDLDLVAPPKEREAVKLSTSSVVVSRHLTSVARSRGPSRCAERAAPAVSE